MPSSSGSRTRSASVSARPQVGRRDIAEDDVLLRRQDRIGRNALHDPPQRRAQAAALRDIDDPAARHGDAEIKPAVALLMPAEMVLDAEGRHRPRRLERLAEVKLELRLGPGLAALGDEVFEARMATVGAVAMIAVQLHD